jgi:8-oxo-dGTP diphosphatase
MSAREEPFAATRENLARAVRDALVEAEGIADNDTAYRQASWLVDVLSAAMTAGGRLRAKAARRIKDENNLSLSQLGERLGVSKARAADMLRVQQARQPESLPQIAALVTSEHGVLAARRRGTKTSWAFIASQQEPGESPGEAASRTVKDQTGLEVSVGRTIVREANPDGGPSIVYVAARPADPHQQLDVKPQGDGDLAEVGWLSLAEAEDLVANMYAPVHAYLSRALRPRFPT